MDQDGGDDRRGRLAVAVMFAVPLAVAGGLSPADNSWLTALATGRLMMRSGWPEVNPFLWNDPQFPIVAPWWSGVLAVVDLAGGVGPRLLTAVLGACLGVLLARLASLLRSSAWTWPAIICTSVLLVATFGVFVVPRAQVASYVLLAVALVLWWERRAVWWQLPVFATWVNMHGSWTLGVLILAGLVVYRGLGRDRPVGWAAPLVAVVGAAAGSLLSPQPGAAFMLPFSQTVDPLAREALATYQEWQPAAIGDFFVWAFVLFVVAAFAGAVRHRDRAGAVFVAGALLALTSVRLLPVAAIVVVPWVGLATERWVRFPVVFAERARVLLGAAVLATLVLTVTGPAINPVRFPVDLVDRLDRAGLADDPDVVIASHARTGNYLEYRFGAVGNVWIDDRPSPRRWLDYVELDDARSGHASLVPDDVDVIIWQNNKVFARWLDSADGWERVAVEQSGSERWTMWCRSELAERCAGG